jgi:thymidine kinase
MSYTIDIDLSQLPTCPTLFKNLDNNISLSHLTLCIGPMFAGKTSFLLNKINELNIDNKPFIVIKPIIDTRYNTNKIVNHDGVSYDCISINRIDEIFNNLLFDYHESNTILIDEAQFFPDLYESVKKLLSLGKQIYVAGLNGDYKMKLFGQIINLMSIADNIIYKQPNCDCGKLASFTARIINDNSLIVVGGSDKYIPVCKQCYYKINNIGKMYTNSNQNY